MSAATFGQFLKELRHRREVTLRDHCIASGFDPGNYSRMERGLFPPPQKRELLEKYAAALGLEEGSDDWYQFFDLAAASRGEIPEDLRSEQVLAKLPLLFRTLRGSPVDPAKLDELVERIKKG